MRVPRPTYANVMATLAVGIALTTGTAYAAGLADDSVRSRHIVDGAVKDADLGSGSVGRRALADDSVGAGELASGSVGSQEIAPGSVDGGRILDESIGAIDVARDAISSTRMTVGVKNLLFNAGTVAVNKTFGDITVSNGSWPAGAPDSGAQASASWTQPAETLDIVSGYARVEFPEGCSATASTSRGFDVKITDASGRVISASGAQRTDGTNYNGNGFWSEQTELPGVSFRAPNGSDLASDPDDFVDYIHLPFELAETVTGSSTAEREVRVFFKRSSSTCTPVVTGTRILVIRYTLP